MRQTDNHPLPPVGELPALSMGLRGCAPEQWLDGPDAFNDQDMRARQLAEKQGLLSEKTADVFACLDEGCAAAQDAADTIAGHLRAHHPDQPPPQQPVNLHQITTLIPEDVLILTPAQMSAAGTDWRLVAASLCFPSHWRLAEKMGLSITAIHRPVPGFADRLAAPVNRFFTTMQSGRLSQRLNWSVQTGDKLHAPARPPFDAAARTAEAWEEIIHIRIERQCFYKLPVTGAVIFTIRTSLAPLKRFRQQPGFIEAVLGQADKLTPAFYAYKSLGEVEDGLRVWIDKHLSCPT